MIPWFLPALIMVAFTVGAFIWLAWYLLTHPNPLSRRTLGLVMGSTGGSILGILFACFLNFFMLAVTLWQLEIAWIANIAWANNPDACYWWPFLFTGCWVPYIARDAWYTIWIMSDILSFIVLGLSSRTVRASIRRLVH